MKLDVFADLVFDELPLRQKTVVNYKSAYRNHLQIPIGSLDLSEIKRQDIQRIIRPMPPQIGATTLAVMKTIYREAIERELVEASPVHGIKTPKAMVEPRNFLTYEEVCDRDWGKYRVWIHFFALHGLRWGEAVALTEQDVRNGRVYINKSMHGPTKSRAGIRTVPLVSEFRPFPATPKGVRRKCHEHEITIHSLRHTYAYLLKQQGVHVTTAQKLLGHADPRVTLGIYTQFRDEEIDQTGNILSMYKQSLMDAAIPKTAIQTAIAI